VDGDDSGGAHELSESARQWFADLSIIDHYCESAPEYAGRWTEDNGRSYVVAFTRDIELLLGQLQRLLSDPSMVRAVHFRYSYQHLLEVRDRIPSILGTTDGLAAWGPDVKGNCVVVSALPEHFVEIRRILMATNPNDVRVEVGNPVFPAET